MAQLLSQMGNRAYTVTCCNVSFKIPILLTFYLKLKLHHYVINLTNVVISDVYPNKYPNPGF